MGDTPISWTHRPGTRGRTWNPVFGCRNKSEGCRNCYAKAQAARIVRMSRGKPSRYDGIVKLHRDGYAAAQWTGEIGIDPDTLAAPLRWRQPSTVFVDSMSDLFYDKRPNEHIAAVFGVMAACPQHTFIVLTKYSERMRRWFEWVGRMACIDGNAGAWCIQGLDDEYPDMLGDRVFLGVPWPLPNVWLLVSTENQETFDERWRDLEATPAVVRGISAEPLLGPIVIPRHDQSMGPSYSPLSWVVSGCESGHGARPADVEWFRSLRDQCAMSGVPFFFKQGVELGDDGPDEDPREVGYSGGYVRPATVLAGAGSRRKPGGVIELPYLDGVQHAAFPEARHG